MASVRNLTKSGGLRWHPDADTVNAPDGVLLRADNLVPDRDGAMSLRQGSEILYSSLGTDVHSLYTAELENGSTYRVAGVDSKIFINGTEELSVVDGSGDLAIGDDAYQIFMARGSTKKKYDGTNLYEWSPARPIAAPDLAAVTSITSTVADFNNSESPATTIQEGSGTVGGASDQDGNANEATEVTPSGNSRAVIQRLWTSDQNFDDIGSVEGTETDLVDFYLKLANPRNVDSIKVVFGLDNSSTEPFKDNRYEFEFDIKGGVDIPLKDLKSEGYAAYEEAVLGITSSVNPEDKSNIQTPGQVKDTLASVTDQGAPKSNAPADNVWSHLTVTRGQFKRIGNTAGRDWDTVRGFKIIYKTIQGKTDTMTISDAIIIGGGARTLTGTYRCVIRGVREVKDSSGNIIYYEFTPPSAQSDPINLNHQTLQITIGGTILNSLDEQIDKIWIYLFGGWLDSYYRFAVVNAETASGATIDELTIPDGSDFDDADERARITSWGGTVQTTGASSDLVITLNTTELDALTQNIRLEPYQIGCPDNVIDIAGPWNGRMFVLTSEGYVYPSNINSPSSFNSFQVIDLTRYGDPYWIARTGSGIYVGMEKDVVFLQGDGANSPDLAQINLFPQPLNIANPPVDTCHWRESNSVIYRSADGLVELTGGSASFVPTAGTSLLWRGQTRHDISLNLTTGRFRAAIDNKMLYLVVSEGTDTSSNVIYRYSFERQQWSRFQFNEIATSFRSIFNEPDGTLIAGDNSGRIWTLDSSSQQDNSQDIYVNIETPIYDGGEPFIYKDPMDLQLHLVTDSDTATVNILKDGGTSFAGTYSASSAAEGVWRQSLSGLGKFIKAKMEITGTFSKFRLHAINFTYRPRPQRMVYLDAGYLLPDEPRDLVWAQEVEFDANCTEDFTMEVYRNDSLYYSVDWTVPTTGVRDVHRIPVPRETKGERLRFVFKSDTESSSGDVGFDPYGVRVRVRSTGNEDRQRRYLKLYPAGEAP